MLIRELLPEQRIVFMPFGYNQGDFRSNYITKKLKIALCGEGSKNNYLLDGALPEQIHIVERPINTKVYSPLDILRDKFRLLMVARFHPMKRIPEIIETLNPLFVKHKNMRFCIVADKNPPHYTNEMHKEYKRVVDTINRYQLEKQVLLLGKCEGKELIKQYSRAYIHILPSTLDRRNTATQEAITMGMQCINTNKQAYDWPEFTESGQRLIHYVSELDEYIPIIENLFHQEIIPGNRKYALQHWSWSMWVCKYKELFCDW